MTREHCCRQLSGAAGLALAVWGGCGVIPLPGGNAGPAPGASFDTAAPVTFADDGTLTLQNTLVGDDVHVFDLGPLGPGDHLVVETRAAAGSRLDPTTAIFDGNHDLFTVNDDVDTLAGRFESRIDETIRAASDHYYLAIAPSFFGTSAGSYSCNVRLTHGAPLDRPPGQVVYLNFSGGVADVPNVGTFTLSAFDAARIDPAYAGHTEEIRRTIVDTVRENFAGLNITLVDSIEEPRPDGDYSEVFFGGFSSSAFGISERVDHWNSSRSDRSIVFTDRFDDPFRARPSVQGIGVAIGNVAAHEIGHLLGLEHTAEITDVMDTTGTATTLLADQEFTRARLDQSVFPIGSQDSMAILAMVLGLLAM